MIRVAVAVALLFVAAAAEPVQTRGVLKIRAVLVDAEGRQTPVPRHVLLVSDNPVSGPPHRVVTRADGSADLSLPPGNYTVESDRPIALEGRSYAWTLSADVVPGRDTVLELNAGNATVETAANAPTEPGTSPASDPSFLLPKWQDSVVSIWTSRAAGSGFLVDARGLIVTSGRLVGADASVEVQLTRDMKVAGRVLATDAALDVSILWINPAVMAKRPPVPLVCDAAQPTAARGQEVYAIGASPVQSRRLSSGTVSTFTKTPVVNDLAFAAAGPGAPVFAAEGQVIGITGIGGEQDPDENDSLRIHPVEHVCRLLVAAAPKAAGAPPADTRLPVEPYPPIPRESLQALAQRRAGSLQPYVISSANFDIAFITPVMIHASRSSAAARGLADPMRIMDFGNWSGYVRDNPPVLLVRVTPKLEEGFWTRVARGAARTKGLDLPPIKRFTAGFSRLRAFCGDGEVAPIHPFTIETKVSETDSIAEGLYVFDPGAFGLHCSAVTLSLYSQKDPAKEDSRAVDPTLVQQVWQDFESYRASRR